MPTKAGFKKPGDAYFEKYLLFDDLPTIQLPKNTAIKGGWRKCYSPLESGRLSTATCLLETCWWRYLVVSGLDEVSGVSKRHVIRRRRWLVSGILQLFLSLSRRLNLPSSLRSYARSLSSSMSRPRLCDRLVCRSLTGATRNGGVIQTKVSFPQWR